MNASVRPLREAGITDVYVVLGAWVGEVPQSRVIENPDFATGMASSLRAGLAYLSTEKLDVDGVVITLVDHIGLNVEALADFIHQEGRHSSAS